MFKDHVLVLATRNQGKVREISRWFASLDLEIKSVADFPNAPEVEEDGHTFRENAVKKAETISRFLQLPCLADDSGLEVDALAGKPGVYSARFAGPDATDEDNNQKLLTLMQDIPFGERTARFRSVLALAFPEENRATITAEGIVEGHILSEPRGTGGFGYDPLFFLPQLKKSMAELTAEEKNQISHRGNALRELRRILNEEYGVDLSQPAG